ncbi:MAG: transposase [Rickettsiales bacterium]|jgi:transposase
MSKQLQKYNSDFKLKVALEYLSGGFTIFQICQKFGISKVTLNNWVKQFKSNSSLIFKASKLSESSVKNKKEQQQKDHEIANLYKKVGQLTMERDFLKKALPS